MRRKKPATAAKRLVWRISESAPLGAFVDPDEELRPAVPRESVDSSLPSGWMVSSFELLHGADVTEGPDTVPADLFDELFPDFPPTTTPVPPDA
jgi:hypothetical protein